MKLIFTLTILMLCLAFSASGQYDAMNDDSLAQFIKTKYKEFSAKKLAAENEMLERHVPGEPIFDSLVNAMIAEAETSRDRGLMCMAYNYLAQVYMPFANSPGRTEQGKQYADRCLQIAEEAGLDEYKAASFIQYSKYYNNKTQNQKALDYNNQALALANTVGNDSLVAKTYAAMARTWDELSNKLSEFQALLSSRDFAEKSGSHILMLKSYEGLADFYDGLNEYEKAKDLYATIIDKGREWGEWSEVIDGMRGMGKVFVQQKNDTLGLAYGAKALALADSLKMPDYKIRINIDLLNYYLNSSDPGKGVAYIKSTPAIMEFINKLGIQYEIKKVRAYIFANNKQYDSALYLMQQVSPEYYAKAAFGSKYSFVILWTQMLDSAGKRADALQKLLFAKSMADSAANLDAQEDVSERLYKHYDMLGDYKQSLVFYKQYNIYKDSVDNLGKQKDLLTVEIGNTNRRIERQKIEEEQAQRVRYNLQYMGITAAIASVFIFLVILGVFKMSASVIKALGFFAFIFLFEFIVLLLDEQIHELTGGEPWKVLGIKIIIIGILLPLHHTMEHKVTHYLTNKAHRLRDSLHFRSKKETESGGHL